MKLSDAIASVLWDAALVALASVVSALMIAGVTVMMKVLTGRTLIKDLDTHEGIEGLAVVLSVLATIGRVLTHVYARSRKRK